MIITKKNNLNLDVYSGQEQSGLPLVIWTYNGENNQKFSLIPIEQEYFAVKCMHSGKYLDIADSSMEQGAELIQWDFNGGYNQQFKFEQVSDGYYKIQCRHSQLYLEVQCDNVKQGDKIIQWPYHGGDNQLFKLDSSLQLPSLPQSEIFQAQQRENNIKTIFTKKNHLTFDIESGYIAPGFRLNVQPQTGANNQKFIINPTDNGYSTVQCLHSGLFWTVYGGSKEIFANIIQWEYQGGQNQQFKFEYMYEGYYRIQCRHSGLYLDVELGNVNTGDKIIQYYYNGGDNQLFTMELDNSYNQMSIEYKVISSKENYALDVSYASPMDGAKFFLWPSFETKNQKFIFHPAEDGYYFIECQHSGKYWDIKDASMANGAELIQYSLNCGTNQQFKVEHVKEGLYRIQCRHSQLYINAQGENVRQGDQIIQFEYNGGPNQLFKLEV